MGKATKSGRDTIQSCSVLASHWVKDIEFESVVAVWASVFTLEITHVQLEVFCISATSVFDNEGPAFSFFTFNLLRLKQKSNICFFVKI